MEVQMRAAIALSFALFALPAAAQDKDFFEKLNDALEAALNSGDYAAAANMYTEDAYLLPAGAEMAKGRSAIQAYWIKAGEGVGQVKLTTIDVKPLGNDAVHEVGRFSLKTKGSQSKDVSGKYVVLWQKVGSEWKLATDIWNGDKPSTP